MENKKEEGKQISQVEAKLWKRKEKFMDGPTRRDIPTLSSMLYQLHPQIF